MPGYSGTALHTKLGVKPGHLVAFLDAPDGWSIAPLPDGVRFEPQPSRQADVTIAFIRAQTALDAARPMLVDQLRADASLWIAWPRKAAGHLSDLTDNRVRESLLPTGLVDIKVAALDHDWSGLKFVWRKELRPSA